MSFASKRFLSTVTALALMAGSGFFAPVLAQDAPKLQVTGGLIDRLEGQVDSLKDRLSIQREDMAQGYGNRPPADISGGGGDYGRDGGAEQDAAGLEVRVGHLEEQIRQLTGRVEQMEFGQHKLEDQLRKFQQDVDFRLQGNGGAAGAPPAARPQKRSDADGIIDESPRPPATAQAQMQPMPNDGTPMNLRSSRRNDAFDPSTDPNAPGVPHPLGSMASASTPLAPPANRTEMADTETDPNAPLDLSSGRRPSSGNPSATPSSPPPPGFGTSTAPRQIPLTQAPSQQDQNNGASTQVAAVPPIASPREEFDSALASFKQKEYETSEKGFSAFLQKNPKNPRTADAIYYLGESYFNRGRQREAAEQYLKISTDYSASSRAPEALLRLGMSLKALGAKEQACASFSQITAKYPNAAAWVKTGADRESKRAQC